MDGEGEVGEGEMGDFERVSGILNFENKTSPIDKLLVFSVRLVKSFEIGIKLR